MSLPTQEIQYIEDSQPQKVKVVGGYALQQRLGAGSFATVYKGVKVPGSSQSTSDDGTSSPDKVAIKAIERNSHKLTKKVLANLEIEIAILRTYRHPNIVCMSNVIKTQGHFYLILEYCGGGDVQRLIRTRKSGRLSERLTRRLMRDLAAGLKFLWGQELIHRDIKPQNLLLTGALPLDEINDPDHSVEEEEARRKSDFPSAQFSLKIADFGFARHLQTASLAETLCGSPLYMAPEILQHHRYDAKADLWSVGTVLFEMIAGRPPFNGENHIDLLRNIQRKSVRLPPDVRVSKACVNLLRILLNRNPLSRAGFKEFFEACDVFVALGCEGIAPSNTGTSSGRLPSNDLGTIPENEGNTGSESLMTVATTSQSNPHSNQTVSHADRHQDTQFQKYSDPVFVAPSAVLAPTSARQYPHRLAPLTQSPPLSGIKMPGGVNVPSFTSLGEQARPLWQQQFSAPTELTTMNKRAEMSTNSTSTDEGEFVMVEYGSNSRNDRFDQQVYPTKGSPYYVNTSKPSNLGNPGGVRRSGSRGMLSTSPGTGGLLMGLVGRNRLGQQQNQIISDASFSGEIVSVTKMLTAAEDVGRRAVSVAHLGDSRAYAGMRLVHAAETGSSILSSTPMEEVEEEESDPTDPASKHSLSTEIMGSTGRRPSTSGDNAMADDKGEDSQVEEMPFAISPEAQAVALPSRTTSVSLYQKSSSSMSSMKRPSQKADPTTIRAHFGEALCCYMKVLKMLKSAVGAAQRVSKDLELLTSRVGRNATNSDLQNLQKRCQVTSNWLSQQFQGVLERADAANIEISKISAPTNESGTMSIPSAEELIYNHSLAAGRDGAVKQLLGQYDAARSCYRSAGLLAETLLMEPNISVEDRTVLEGYVDGFATRITELDQLMLQQSRMVSSSNESFSNRASQSGVIGLIGPPPAAPAGFLPRPGS